MKKRLMALFIMIATLLPLLGTAASADMGPKPSVTVTMQGLGEETCYVTLLSQTESAGPRRAGAPYQEHMGDRAAWDAFSAYKDAAGYYFLGCMGKVTEESPFVWGYYPPGRFKVLAWFPERDTYAVSGALTRYAFKSCYIVSLAGDGTLTAERSYPYGAEIGALVLRILLTTAAELGIAWLFGYRARRQVKLICAVNLVTQIVLNVLLNAIACRSGSFLLLFHYGWMELLVFALEGALYSRLLPERGERGAARAWGYALAANLFSFWAGYWLAKWLPGVF